MSNDTQQPRRNVAAEIARNFGGIADTLDWPHPYWLALMAKLQATGKHPDELTLRDIREAISATCPAVAGKDGT